MALVVLVVMGVFVVFGSNSVLGFLFVLALLRV